MIQSVFYPLSTLQLGLRCLEGGDEEVSDVACCFVEVEAHSLTSETLGDDVELDAATPVNMHSFEVGN